MIALIENALDALESSSESAAVAIVDHIRTVAANGREYSTREAILEEARALKGWAQHLENALLKEAK